MRAYYSSFYQRGQKIYIRKIDEDGTRVNYHVDYKPKLYIPTQDKSKACKYTTLTNDMLQEVEFSSPRALRDYADSFRGKLYGYNRIPYACLDDEFPYQIEYKFEDLRIVYLDIETKSDTHFSSVENPDQDIILIQMLYRGTFYILGTKHYESYDDNVKYIRCSDEKDLLKKFVTLFRKIDPDIISGWNSQGYDIPMLYSRMSLLEMEDTFKRLSPFNHIDIGEKIVFNKPQLRVEIMGVQHLDMLELIIKFGGKKYENNKLNTVSNVILGRGKVQYDGNLYDLYVQDFEKFVEYGKVDTELVRDIEEQKNLIRLVAQCAYMDKVNFIDTFSQVRSWDNQIMTDLKHNYNIQVPYSIAKEQDDFVVESDEQFEGAYVFEPVPGKYTWVMSDDVQSMHPSIIMSFNISPETYRGNMKKNVDFFLQDQPEYTQYLIDNKLSSLANGAVFDNTFEGFLPKLVRRVFTMRVNAKNTAKEHKKLLQTAKTDEEKSHHKMMYVINDTIQNALKVKINSMFGFLGNLYSRFYQLDMAEGITLTSQVMLKSGAQVIESTVVGITATQDTVLKYGDTDSVIYSMQSVVDKYVPKDKQPLEIVEFLDRFHTKYIKPALQQKLDTIQSNMNAREHSIRFVRDVISDVSILIAKKKYIMSVWDAEGTRYAKQDFKIMGVESVKTSTPQYCRDKIKDSIEIILYKNESDLHKFIANTKEEFYTLPVEAIATPSGITDIDKYTTESVVQDVFDMEDDVESITYTKGAPMHVKASIYFNKLIKDKNLYNWYQPITNGDKIKYTYLKMPNPIGNNTIGFPDKLPKEFNLDKYVDYKTQWDKKFAKPVQTILDIVGWKMEPSNALF